MRRFATVALLLAAAVPAAAAGMYKVVGADGKVSYADTPPGDARQSKVSAVAVYAAPAATGAATVKPDWEAILRRPIASPAAGRPGSLVMFSTPDCGYCKKAKQYMDASGIAYTEIDIEDDRRGWQEYRRAGGHGVPFFVAGDKTMTGFTKAKLERLLGRAR